MSHCKHETGPRGANPAPMLAFTTATEGTTNLK